MAPVRQFVQESGQRLAGAALLVLLFAGCGQPDPPAATRSVPSSADPVLPLLVDIDGIGHGSPGAPARGKWTSLFFIGTDCPVSNRYVPEIKRICAEYAPAGVDCLLVYSDPTLDQKAIREHLATYEYGLPALLDATHEVTALAGATVTPEVAVFGADAKLAYRGRIDDLFGELGRPRQRVSQRDLRDALEDLVAGRPVRNPRTQAIGCYIEQ